MESSISARADWKRSSGCCPSGSRQIAICLSSSGLRSLLCQLIAGSLDENRSGQDAVRSILPIGSVGSNSFDDRAA
jgi:hypothetical protein